MVYAPSAGCLFSQQIVRALHAVHVGIQLQGLDLCVVHTGQCDADIALCCQNACGQQAQQPSQTRAADSEFVSSYIFPPESKYLSQAPLLNRSGNRGRRRLWEKRKPAILTKWRADLHRNKIRCFSCEEKRRHLFRMLQAELVPRIHPFRRECGADSSSSDLHSGNKLFVSAPVSCLLTESLPQ